jgi:hypothetical protein
LVWFCTAKSTLITGAKRVPPGRNPRSTKFAFWPNENRDKKYKAAAPPTNHSIFRIRKLNAAFYFYVVCQF